LCFCIFYFSRNLLFEKNGESQIEEKFDMGVAINNDYTVDDIYALLEGERVELIDGQIYFMASPNRRHQSILGELYLRIASYIKSKGGDCKVYLAPFAVFINKDNRNYVEPDISVICDPDKLNDKGCDGASDWIIEVVSPGNKNMDYLVKLLKYQSSGVREYWIVDTESERILVYNFEHNEMEVYRLEDKVKAGIYEDLEIDFSTIE
jgi:Uma2 family endonuclease